MSFEPRFNVSDEITADLTRIERARGFPSDDNHAFALDTETGKLVQSAGAGVRTAGRDLQPGRRSHQGAPEAAMLSEDWIRRMSAEAIILEAHHTQP